MASRAQTFSRWPSRPGIVTPEQFLAPADGVTDDTPAFLMALATGRRVVCTGATYVIGDLTPGAHAWIEFGRAHIRRKTGAKHALIVNSFFPTIIGGDFNGQGIWSSSTVNGAVSSGASTITLASAASFVAGMRIFFASDCDKGLETRLIRSIASNTLTLDRAIEGNITNGVKLIGDFAMVKVAGSSLDSPILRDMHIRNCCIGFQRGEDNTSGGNAFGTYSNIHVADFIGAGLVDEANSAGETATGFILEGGKTLTNTYTGNGVTTTFAFPYTVAPLIHRWGSEPSIRAIVDGVTLATTDYTVSGTDIVITVPPGAVQVKAQNFEFACFGHILYSSVSSSPSSIGQMSDSIGISCRVGLWAEGTGNDPELFHVSNVVYDTCSYATVYLKSGQNMRFTGLSALYAPHAVKLGASTKNISIVGLETSLIPTSEEFTPTGDRAELSSTSGASNISIDFASWHSKDGNFLINGTNGFRNRKTRYGGGTIVEEIIAGGTDQWAEFYLKSSRSTADEKYWLISNDASSGNISIRTCNDDGSGAASILSLTRAGKVKINKSGGFFEYANGVQMLSGTGTPEGAVTAPKGSIFQRSDGGAGSTFYVKESGSGNTGWIAK